MCFQWIKPAEMRCLAVVRRRRSPQRTIMNRALFAAIPPPRRATVRQAFFNA